MEDKETMLQAIQETLRSQSQVLLTDYVSRKDGEPSPELKAWTTSERTPAHLWSIDN